MYLSIAASRSHEGLVFTSNKLCFFIYIILFYNHICSLQMNPQHIGSFQLGDLIKLYHTFHNYITKYFIFKARLICFVLSGDICSDLSEHSKFTTFKNRLSCSVLSQYICSDLSEHSPLISVMQGIINNFPLTPEITLSFTKVSVSLSGFCFSL